ncbi:arad-like aldolase/epimerase [Hyaloscypha variabilis F]|uniref:Arad-like aldolase/epimerase n=1 Tax=Hyaloscypha variabilis (strain UAMH 11265 / GT02V1 / F) TaxID=1149755 RepID=A0A2J6RHF9_HYAVF|nr:arad-like aldolase/epimerase [Hyaloscypha variabilis F]
MEYHQTTVAQPAQDVYGHATRAGLTILQHLEQQGGGDFAHPPKFDNKHDEREYLKGRLAAAFRIVGQKGFDEGVAGHISLHDPVEPHNFWFTGLDLISSVLHTLMHPPYARGFSVFGIPLPITSQDGCAFYKDLGSLNSFDGVVVEGDEGTHIAAAVGKTKGAILQNHAILTRANTVEAAVFWFLSLEKLCQTQLLAMAAEASGHKIVEIGESQAAEADSIDYKTYKSVGEPTSGWFSAKPIFDLIAKDTNEDYLA